MHGITISQGCISIWRSTLNGEILLEEWKQVKKKHLPYTGNDVVCEDPCPIRQLQLPGLNQAFPVVEQVREGEDGHVTRRRACRSRVGRLAGRPGGRPADRVGPIGWSRLEGSVEQQGDLRVRVIDTQN